MGKPHLCTLAVTLQAPFPYFLSLLPMRKNGKVKTGDQTQKVIQQVSKKSKLISCVFCCCFVVVVVVAAFFVFFFSVQTRKQWDTSVISPFSGLEAGKKENNKQGVKLVTLVFPVYKTVAKFTSLPSAFGCLLNDYSYSYFTELSFQDR